TLSSVGSVANTVIIAQNPDQDLIIMNQKCKVFGLTLNGSYGNGARGVYFDGTQSGGQGKFSTIGECFIIDCNVGIECDGKNGIGMIDTLYCDKIVIQAHAHTLDKGVYCHGRGQFIATTCYAFGIPIMFPMNYGYYCIDQGSKIALNTA